MNYTPLITQNWITTYTPIGEFVDMRILVPFIRVSQEIHIRSLVGNDQYSRLVDGTIANDLTSDENTLLDFIRPTLAYDMVARNIPFIATQIRGSGVVKVANANIESASQKSVDSLQNTAQSYADYYSQRLIKYLCDNLALYPLYSSDSDPKANSRTRYGNFFFEDDGDCCNEC